MKLSIRLCGAVMLVASIAAQAKEIEVTQKNAEFSQKKVTIKVGDSINFKNEDPFFHNVFSLSDIKVFDLGSFPKGQSRKVTFDKPGKVEVECAVHENMKLIVDVEK